VSKKAVFLSIGAVVLAAGGYYAWQSTRPAAVTYKENTVKRGTVSVSILATGTVQPENRLEIKPPIAGRVDSVLVKEGQRVARGQILAWMSSSERAALLDAARSAGPEELKRWEDMYRSTPIIAPIPGTIILRNVESGQSFTSSDAILVVSDRLTVKAQVDETDISQIKLKQSAEIVLDAYAGKKVPAVVDQIAFEAKTVNNVTTYVVDVLPQTTPEFMRAGMTANVTFTTDTRDDALLVPNDALKTPETVLVKGPDGKPVERPVKTGITDGKRTEVLEGLAENDVVLSAQVSIRDGKSRNKASSPFTPTGPRGGGGGGGRR
jgi:macrolide-specific efflux system membrane fusion protein